MKRFFALAAAILAVATFNISCEGVKNAVEYKTELASLVDGTPESGNFYVIFDNETKAYVTNASQITIPSSAYTDGEARARITYSEDGAKQGFDKAIKLASYVPVFTDLPYKKLQSDIDFNSHKTYFDILNATYARNYINVSVGYMYSSNPLMHDFYLVYNAEPDKEENGLFKGHYFNDGYLYLELYHNINGEPEIEWYENIISYKFDPASLGINIDDYIGIKILYRSFKDQNAIRDYTIKFQ